MSQDELDNAALQDACHDIEENYGNTNVSFVIGRHGFAQSVSQYLTEHGCSWARDPVKAEETLFRLVTSQEYKSALVPLEHIAQACEEARMHNLPYTTQMESSIAKTA